MKAWRVVVTVAAILLLVSAVVRAQRVAEAEPRCIDTRIGPICSEPETDAAAEFAQWLALVALFGTPLGIWYVVLRNRGDDS